LDVVLMLVNRALRPKVPRPKRHYLWYAFRLHPCNFSIVRY
jgi:hypothetical protein